MTGAGRRMAIIATHPIQYQVPWFRGLASRGVDLKVYFALIPDARQQGHGFGVSFQWDIPLLEGYRWDVLRNATAHPDLGRFLGLSTPDIAEALRRDRPDALLVTGWNSRPLVQALLAAERLRIPRLLRAESSGLKPRPLGVRAIHRILLSRFQAFLAIGKANHAFYRANGVPESRIVRAPYFVDNDRFAGAAGALRAQRAALRASWGIPEGTICLLYAGKLEPKKRILDVIAALGRARPPGAPLHLLVVGAGELEPAARAAAAGLPVTFAGFLNQTEMPRAYVAADALVLASDYGETWGLVVNEAMACGLPAIVSDRVGCGPDLVDDGVTGHVFPFGDVASLGGLFARLASAPGGLAAMGARARERVARYSIDAAVDGTLRGLALLSDRRA